MLQLIPSATDMIIIAATVLLAILAILLALVSVLLGDLWILTVKPLMEIVVRNVSQDILFLGENVNR